MTWSRPPFEARLGDVPIVVTSSRDIVARALVLHAYPDRDGADLEDAGGEPLEVSLEGYVSGVAWYARLILLQSELRRTGVLHELVHPQHGTLFGRVRRLEISHRDEEHDLARLTLDFVEGTLAEFSYELGGSVAASAASIESAAADVLAALAAL